MPLQKFVRRRCACYFSLPYEHQHGSSLCIRFCSETSKFVRVDIIAKADCLLILTVYVIRCLSCVTSVDWLVDSGNFLRKPELQVQLGQSNSLKIGMTCCFYTGIKGDIYPQAGRGKGVTAMLKEGDWYTIRARGDCFEVWLNGSKTTDYTSAAYAGIAPIGLQAHPGLAMSVQFKDIVV
jgi:hypothetical protein